MILLDTNVLSELMKTKADARVISWLDNQPRNSLWTTSISILEVRFGLQIVPAGQRRTQLIEAFDLVFREKIKRRVASFDTEAARHAADLMEARQKAGRPGELRDTVIAGIALATKATLATGNVRHFADLRISVINPWMD